MSEKRYIVTEKQISKGIRFALELYKECSSIDLDIMLKACASAVSDRIEDGSALFVSNDKGKYEKYDWATILEWIGEVHSTLFDKESE